MVFLPKLQFTHIASKAINDNNLSPGLTFAILFVVIVAFTLIGIYEKKLTPDTLHTEDKESIGTIDFYNQFFAGQGIPFFLVEDIRNILFEYDLLRRHDLSHVDNVSKLHADEDFSLIWGFDPQEAIIGGVRSMFAINIDTYEAYYGIHTIRELVNIVSQNLKPPSLNILFICADNSCASIMAEALSNYLGRGRFLAFSASSHPVAEVNPNTLATLENNGLPIGGYRSKSWDELADKKIDLMITLNDSTGDEAYPAYLESATRVHWALPNPADVAGEEIEVAKAFQSTYDALVILIKQMLSMPLESMQPIEITRSFNRIYSES